MKSDLSFRISRRFAFGALAVLLGFVSSSFLGSQTATSPEANSRPISANGSSVARLEAGRPEDRLDKSVYLTQVVQVRRLSREEAASLRPVRITGVVTAVTGYKNSFFLQDETAGISVDRTDDGLVHVGERVEVSGTSSPGLFAPVILASSVQVLGSALPPPARQVTYADLIGGSEDGSWIEVHGVVHSARIYPFFSRDVLSLSVDLGGGTMHVLLQDFAGVDFKRLVDSTVRIRGVCAASFNVKRQFVGLAMFVPDRRDIVVVDAVKGDIFDAPVTPVGNAMQFGQTLHRIKVKGIVTYGSPGNAIYLQDGKDGIQIQSSVRSSAEVGDIVEAVGFPVMGEYAPILQDGSFRVVGKTTPIVPALIESRDVITQHAAFDSIPYDQQLVQLKGTVVENRTHAGRQALILRQNNEVFEAYLPTADDGTTREIDIGSVLLVSGICVVHVDSERTPVSFGILLRSTSDIVLVKRALWWTPTHTLVVLAGVTGVTLLVILWVAVLRHRVEQQTRTIRASEGRFRELAAQDVLTGLPNRRVLEDEVSGCLERAEKANMRAAVMTIDIDRFKQINDKFGHITGDEVLKVVANRLRSRVRAIDIIARTGGEEFTLVIGQLNGPESAKRVANTLVNLFRDTVVVPGHEIKMTISVGVAVYPEDGRDAETLRKRSDQALYEAKRTGRDRAILATEEIARSCELPSAIESALREALRSDAFLLFYQPICDSSGGIYCFEALLRTKDPWLTELGPAGYIPIAEEIGLIVPLGRWIVEEACRQIVEWRSVGIDCPIAVNVSGFQLLQHDFSDYILSILKRFDVEPGMVILELTETTVMTDHSTVTETVAKLARAGVTFAIDDFGMGYSSLSRLNELPLKFLKIDRSFIDRLKKNNRAHMIIVAVLQMAKGLGLQVVAEGVERVDQFEMMRDLGCEFFQGYLFARATPAASTIKMLKGNHSMLPTAAVENETNPLGTKMAVRLKLEEIGQKA